MQNVVARLQQLGGGEAIPLEGREENIVFEVPKELRVDIREVDYVISSLSYAKIPGVFPGIVKVTAQYWLTGRWPPG